MRQRLSIILTFVVIIGLLVVFNALTYVRPPEKTRDFEIAPNRSTYHSGPTGLRALHDFLNESGYKVIRWRETPQKLLGDSGKSVTTFVVVGLTQLPIEPEEAKALREWVARGGRLILIDRLIDPELLPPSAGLRGREVDAPNIYTDPADVKSMTENVVALQPVQPSVMTSSVRSVLPSRFASRLRVLSPEEQLAENNVSTSRSDEESEATPQSSASRAAVVHIADPSDRFERDQGAVEQVREGVADRSFFEQLAHTANLPLACEQYRLSFAVEYRQREHEQVMVFLVDHDRRKAGRAI